MKKPHSSTTSHYIVRNKKMFGRTFYFPTGICSYSFRRAFEQDSRFYHLSKPRYRHLAHPEYMKTGKIVHDSVVTCFHP